VAIVGIGSELRSDDAIGGMVARRLKSRLPGRETLLVLETGAVPESFTGVLRRFRPDLVLMVDAADLGVEPGGVEIVLWQEVGGFSASGHALPVSVVAGFLRAELGCDLYLVGVQPGSLEFLGKMTKEGKRGVRRVVEAVGRWVEGAERED
jgi:hydrogenase maturation protease HycI